MDRGCWNKNVHGGKKLKKISGEEHLLGTQE